MIFRFLIDKNLINRLLYAWITHPLGQNEQKRLYSCFVNICDMSVTFLSRTFLVTSTRILTISSSGSPMLRILTMESIIFCTLLFGAAVVVLKGEGNGSTLLNKMYKEKNKRHFEPSIVLIWIWKEITC